VQVIESTQAPQLRVASFEAAFNQVENSRWLLLGLIAAGTLSSVITPHAPLAVLAAIGGVVLMPRRAMEVTLLIWLIDQAAGLALRGYPIEQLSMSWAAVMGAGALAVSLLFSHGPGFCRRSWGGHTLWSLLSLMGGFLLYQGTIALVYPVNVDCHSIGAEVISGLLQQ